jgi:hypothetical protein
MQEFIHLKNVALYERLLAETPDSAQRKLLLKLLADEKAKDSLSKAPRSANGE